MTSCFLYCCSVLSLTTLWVYFGRTLPFQVLANAMYLPTVLAFVFADNIGGFISQVLGMHKILDGIIWSVAAILIVYIIVYACVVLNLALGWATNSREETSGVHAHNKLPLMGFLRAAGEEIGWRCFLLPCLMSTYTPTVALTISGIVWGLFHVPVMLLLTRLLRPERPAITVMVQFAAVVLNAFPIGWLTIKSGYSLWASAIMHFTWNRVNPRVLGSIYTQSPGQYQGKQWKINGEGLAGCIVMMPVCALVIMDFSTS